MLGRAFPETLRLKGNILNNELKILVDDGSTHNFIQDRIAKFLDLPVADSDKF